MDSEMLKDLILTAKKNEMNNIDDLHSLYVDAVCARVKNGSAKNIELLRTARENLRTAIWKSMFLEQKIRDKYKEE